MSEKYLSVSQLNEMVRENLETNLLLQNIHIEGEISNFKKHYSGHCYFVLKDAQAAIRCVMFQGYAGKLTFLPQDGMRVILRGSVSLYTKDGQYQFYTIHMQKYGLGEFLIAFEKLKAKLDAEGLFDVNRKKQIPVFVRRIGVITSPTGAAIRDIIHVATRRMPGIQISLYPVKVQGEGAAQEIAEAICKMNRIGHFDVLIVGRGGGSIEDLWAFNEPCVAYAIGESKIPIISAVGHEIDFTIADFVADLRAPTPSSAAEMAVQDKTELMRRVANLYQKLWLINANVFSSSNQQLSHLHKSLIQHSPHIKIRNYRQQIDHLNQLIVLHSISHAKESKERYKAIVSRLNAVSPLAVLSRGYAVVQDEDGKIITSVKNTRKNQYIDIRFIDGKVSARFTS